MQQATLIFHRLAEVEKITLRAAKTPGRLEWLALNSFQSDLPQRSDQEKIDIITEVKALCDLQSATKGASMEFGQTWLF